MSLRWRLEEDTDTRVTIVAITENDIQEELGYPISDQALADLIETLQTYEPRAIGIDIFRDAPVGEGASAALREVLQRADNVIGINKIHDATVQPPRGLSEEQIGFVDANLDDDGFLRRSLLADEDNDGAYRFSLTVRMVEQYLAPEGIILENGIRDPETMRFGTTEIPRFQPNTGGYVQTNNGGNQALINFRAGERPFEKVSYTDLISGKVDTSLLQDRAVLVGYTAESVKDFVSSLAIETDSPSLIPGVEIQAHAVSQILSAIYDDRAFLKSVPEGIEYALMLAGGLLGMALARWRRPSALHLLMIIGLSGAWILLCYGFILVSWWVPLVPTVAAFVLNAIALYPFYQTQAHVRSQISAREDILDQTYDTIHNGPLQTLASMLRRWPEDESAGPEMRAELKALNQELREVHASIRQNQLAITGQGILDPQVPLQDLLRETYEKTIERHRSFFEPVTKITDFQPMADSQLSADQKQNLARFLEEALINTQKYATGTTRITITCMSKAGENIIRVVDNGAGLPDKPHGTPAKSRGGHGTKRAQKLARKLAGSFNRTALEPKGVCCELRWPSQRPFWKG